jgi:virulence factor
VGKVKIAMVGVGAMTQRVHLPSLASFDDTQIVGICDLDEDRGRKVAEQYGVEHQYTDYREMVETLAPDGVYAVGQPHLMYDVWVWCLQRGVPLYIEKPLGLSWHQAQMLTRLAAENDVVTQVSFQRRSSPLLKTLKQECTASGPITHAICEFYKNDLRPMWSARDHMLDDCVHAIDTVRWLCGGSVIGIESQCKRLGVPDINWIMAMLHFDNGSTGAVVTSWSSGRRVFRVQMHATGICAEADPEVGGSLYAADRSERYDAREVAGSDELYSYGGFQAKNREFIDSLASASRMTSSPFEDAVETMRVADQILAHASLQNQ